MENYDNRNDKFKSVIDLSRTYDVTQIYFSHVFGALPEYLTCEFECAIVYAHKM